MAPEYADYLKQLRAQDAALADALADRTSLDKVLGWLHASGMALAQVEAIPQDEYSHDILMPLPDHRWLAFAVT